MIYRFQQLNDIKPYAWERFIVKAELAFTELQKLNDDADCEFYGQLYDVTGSFKVNLFKDLLPVADMFEAETLAFNAADGTDQNTFLVSRLLADSHRWIGVCQTDDKSHDWFVKTILLLLYNNCINAYQIESDKKIEGWTPVAEWLSNLFPGKPYRIPGATPLIYSAVSGA